jgi:hypothetical protein
MKSASTLVPAGPAGPRQSSIESLRRYVDRCRLAMLYRLADEVAEMQDRCQHAVSDDEGTRGLADAVDRELHKLAVRLTGELDRTFRAIVERALGGAFGRRSAEHPRRLMVDRVRAAGARRPDEVLLVTRTAEVIRIHGTGTQTALSAYRIRSEPPVVKPIEVELAAGSYQLWRQRDDATAVEVQRWLQGALDSVAAELLREVVARFHDMYEAVTGTLDESAGALVTVETADRAA